MSDDFEIVRNRCRSTLGIGRSCYLDIKVTYDESLGDSTVKLFPIDNKSNELQNPFFNLVIEIDESYIAGLESLGDAVVKSESVINFGSLKEGESSRKRFYFINTSETASVASPVISSPENSSLTINNSCSESIPKRSSCHVDIEYNYEGIVGETVTLNETISISSNNMSEESKSIIVQASNVSQIDSTTPKISLTEISLENLKVGSIVKRIYVSNAIGQDFSFDSSNLIESGASELKNTCRSLILKKDSYCYVDIEISVNSENEEVSIPIEIPAANISKIISNEIENNEPIDIVKEFAFTTDDIFVLKNNGEIQSTVFGNSFSTSSPVERLISSNIGYYFGIETADKSFLKVVATNVQAPYIENDGLITNTIKNKISSASNWYLSEKSDGSLLMTSISSGDGYVGPTKFPLEKNWDEILEVHDSPDPIFLVAKSDGSGDYKIGIASIYNTTTDPNQSFYCPEDNYVRALLSSSSDNIPSCFSSGMTLNYEGNVYSGVGILKNNGSVAFYSNGASGENNGGLNPLDPTVGIDCNKDGSRGDADCLKSGVIDIEGSYTGLSILKSDGSVHIWGRPDIDYSKTECATGTGISCLANGNDQILSNRTGILLTLNDGFIRSLSTSNNNIVISDITSELEPQERITDIKGGRTDFFITGDKGTVIYYRSSVKTVHKNIVQSYFSDNNSVANALLINQSNEKYLVGPVVQNYHFSLSYEISNLINAEIANAHLGYRNALLKLENGSYYAIGTEFETPSMYLSRDTETNEIFMEYDIRAIMPINGIAPSTGKEIYLTKLGMHNSCSSGTAIGLNLAEDISRITKRDVSQDIINSGVNYLSETYGLCSSEDINNLDTLISGAGSIEDISSNFIEFVSDFDTLRIDPNSPDINYMIFNDFGPFYYVDLVGSDFFDPSGDEDSCLSSGGIWQIYNDTSSEECVPSGFLQVDYFNQSPETQQFIDDNSF